MKADYTQRLYYCSNTGEGKKIRKEIEKKIREIEKKINQKELERMWLVTNSDPVYSANMRKILYGGD
ncbi:MAG: hypothetical protein AB1478_02740 [Nitrospirota bacterium]